MTSEHTLPPDVLARFHAKIVTSPTGCWLWTAYKNQKGYGLFRVGRRVVRAHRVAYEHVRGPVPAGRELDHRCRVRACVNPDHLEAVPHAENVARGETGINSRRKTHCPSGHEYAGANVRITRAGKRACRACARDRWHRRRGSAGGGA